MSTDSAYFAVLYRCFSRLVLTPTSGWDRVSSRGWLDPPYRTRVPSRVITPIDFEKCDEWLKPLGLSSKSIRVKNTFYMTPLDFLYPEWLLYKIHGPESPLVNPDDIAEFLASDWPPFYLRSIDGSVRLNIHSTISQPHAYFTEGFRTQGFAFGDPIVICEGILDAESLSQVYPFVVASMTASISPPLATLLSLLTNKVIVCYDNDEAGQKGAWKAKRTLEPLGIRFSRLELPQPLKDAGELLYDYSGMADFLHPILRASIEASAL